MKTRNCRLFVLVVLPVLLANLGCRNKQRDVDFQSFAVCCQTIDSMRVFDMGRALLAEDSSARNSGCLSDSCLNLILDQLQQFGARLAVLDSHFIVLNAKYPRDAHLDSANAYFVVLKAKRDSIGFLSRAIQTYKTRKAEEAEDPRNRFRRTRNKGVEFEGLTRTYKFDEVKAASPGQEIAQMERLSLLANGNYFHSKYQFSYKGRTAENNIMIGRVKYIEGSGYVICDTAFEVSYFIKAPDSVTRIKFDGPDEPTLILDVTLDGPDLWYKVVADAYSPL